MIDIIILVDPYISWKEVYKTLSQYNVYTIALILNKDHQNYKNIMKLDYDEIHKIENEEKSIIDLLENIKSRENTRIKFILNGSDDSNVFTEKLTSHFNSEHSNGSKSALITNKYETIETLKNNNLSTQKQTIVNLNNYDFEIERVKHFSFPIILKPNLEGSGKEGVMICSDISKLNKSIFNISHSVSNAKFGSYVIQEFMLGKEIFIDTVSINKKHKIIGIFEYDKEVNISKNEITFKGINVIPECSKEYTIIKSYINKIFNCLEIRNGINHTEVIFQENGNIELIEINPRLSGGNGCAHTMSRLLYGHDQLNYLLDNLNLSLMKEKTKNTIYSYCKTVFLYNYMFSDSLFKELLSKLENCHIKLLLDKEQNINIKIKNWRNIRKIVVIASNNLKDLSNALKILYKLEKQNISED